MSREAKIARAGIIGIIANVLLAIFKIICAYLSSSLAIALDGVNNFGDALSSLITVIGNKLAYKKADYNHPYGHGRFEYLATLLIGAILFVVGTLSLVESIKKISSNQVNYSNWAIIVMIVALVVKIYLIHLFTKTSEETNNATLKATAADTFSDVAISLATLLAIIVFRLFNVVLEAYLAILISIYIIYNGIKVLIETISRILGLRVNSEDAQKVISEVLKIEGVDGVYDLQMSDYGPNNKFLSLAIEVKGDTKATKIDRISHLVKESVKENCGYNVTAVGIYAGVNEEAIALKEDISKLVLKNKDIKAVHGFYIDESKIHFDMVVSYSCDNREKLLNKVKEKIKEKYPEHSISIDVDDDISG